MDNLLHLIVFQPLYYPVNCPPQDVDVGLQNRRVKLYINNNKSSAMKQTPGRQVGEVREHEFNMHVCVAVG